MVRWLSEGKEKADERLSTNLGCKSELNQGQTWPGGAADGILKSRKKQAQGICGVRSGADLHAETS